MEDITEKVKNKAKKDLDRQTSPLMDEVLKYDKVQMPEEVFKGRYLDSFVNGGNPEAIKEFASVAGGYRNEVEVVDGKGNVLFTTPPILTSPDFAAIEEIKATDLAGLGKETEQKINTGHLNATKELDNTLNTVEGKMLHVANEAGKEHDTRWNLIFTRYGVSNTKAVKEEDDLEFNYDD